MKGQSTKPANENEGQHTGGQRRTEGDREMVVEGLGSGSSRKKDVNNKEN